MTIFLILLLPFLAILPAWAIGAHNRLASTVVAALATAASLGLLLSHAPQVFDGNIFVHTWPWLESLGLNASFRLDGLGLLFGILILGIGLLVVLYASYYLSEDDPIGPFHAMLLTFMGAMLGVVLSENLLLMVMFWELTSISSFLLIAYWKHLPEARQGARLALTITGGGGLALLAGILLLSHITGSYELSTILASNAAITGHALYVPALVLILLGAFTKSAQFPFHFWLPNAMTAPTPVSAYLHSATMVKAGVFLLARLHPALSGTSEWFTLVTTAGLITMVFAAYVALFKDDLKGLLAYSTISHLGLITALFGFSTKMATVAAVFHIINHAAFKAGLFMTAGIVDHEAGTRDLKRLGGLRHLMPITFALGTVAALAMAGLPPFNGFLSKEMFFDEAFKLSADPRMTMMAYAPAILVTVGGLFSIAYSLRFIFGTFTGPKRDDYPGKPHDPPVGMWLPVALLAAICVAIGIVPNLVAGPLLAAASTAVLGGNLPEYSVSIWHGLTPALGMTAVAIVLGIAAFRAQAKLATLPGLNLNGKALTEAAIDRVMKLANQATGLIDNGSLQRYLGFSIGFAALAGFWGYFELGWSDGTKAPTPAPLLALLPWGMLVASTIYTVYFQRTRLVALVFMSVVGLIVSLTFIFFSAPDLGLTQLSVEVVTILLLLLALYVLPQSVEPLSTPARRFRDGAIATVAALGVGSLSWAVMTRPLNSISSYYLDQSLPMGGGTNVVNVILVDFRGFDTMGEVSVLVIAAVGVLVMLRGRRPAHPGQNLVLDEERFPVMLTTITRPLMPLMALIAIYIFLRGHNLPGGGFIAGLVASVALLMQYLASGLNWSNARMKIDFVRLGAVGVIIAVGTGLLAFVMEGTFLTHKMWHPVIPGIGEIHIGTAALFDLGVFFAVIGALLVMLRRLSEYQRATFINETPGDDT